MIDLIEIPINSLKDKRLENIHSDVMSLLYEEDLWLAGGAIRSLFTNEVPSDYDLFFKNERTLLDTAILLEDWGYTKVFECPKGSLRSYIGTEDDIKIQLISPRYYSTPEVLLNTFDFTITLGAMSESTLYISKEFIKSLRKKQLKLHKLSYPTATINRAYKYKVKGYNIASCLLDIVQRIYENSEEIIDNSVYYID